MVRLVVSAVSLTARTVREDRARGSDRDVIESRNDLASRPNPHSMYP